MNNISFIIFVLSLKTLVNLSAKTQDTKKVNKTDHRDIQTQTEEYDGEPILALPYKGIEELPKVFKQPTLIYPVTIQEQLPNDRYPQGCARAKWTPVEMLELKRQKEMIVSYGIHSPFVKQMF